ncbi:ribonuclease P protein component [Sporosalibacterium faouarense]|uniref:ribonuclease P protein component n=1 Tax=Sporosalibacterium faouarense TaxID=516123 RepID=UPI00141C0636|nr:ribonuclease P protein component [Sporosalibacterium faouarense]MTI49789.1 ribonuclease P protein component [Bacillota bacterium]
MNNYESLRNNKDFRNVYDKGKSFANRYLVMFYLKNNMEISRVGFSVTKKLGNAVVRNKVKRRMKESYRINSNKFRNGYDIVFLSRVKAKDANFKEIESAILHIGKLAKLIKKGE